MGKAWSAIAWLALPVFAPTIAWLIIRSQQRRDPNADIESGVQGMRKLRDALATSEATDDSDGLEFEDDESAQ